LANGRTGLHKELGHSEAIHGVIVGGADEAALAAFMRREAAGLEQTGCLALRRAIELGLPVAEVEMTSFDRCGWWWCRAPSGKVPWADMSAALRRLRRVSKIDPHCMDVARLAHDFTSVEDWARERDGYVKLEEALRDLDIGRHAGELRDGYLAEVRSYLAPVPKRSEGKDGRPVIHHHRAAVIFAQQRGWAAEDVAAVMLLTGAERLEKNENFDVLKDRWRKRFQRVDEPRGRN
jgi:hypothetical protein